MILPFNWFRKYFNYKPIKEKAMERIKVSENFFLDEFVDPHSYLTRSDNGRSLIDERIIDIAQKVRDFKGSGITINNWWNHIDKYQGEFKGDAMKFLKYCNDSSFIRCWSGFRSELCKIGASNSAHRKGFAIDMAGDQNEYYRIVKTNAKLFYSLGVRRLEDRRITNGWMHCDTWERNTQPNSIRVVDLTKCTETIRW
jgi:hypothetical protein